MRPHILRVLAFPAVAVTLLGLALPGAGTAAAAPVPGPVSASAHPVTAYVVNYFTGTVTPVNTVTDTALKTIPVGNSPFIIAITPDGKIAYVNGMSAAGGIWGVTPISTAANKAGKVIKVPGEPYAFAITPDSRTLYVADIDANTVIPVSTATNKPGEPIAVGTQPVHIAITPNGKTAYVANLASGTVTPITVATGKPGKPVKVGADPTYIAITPDGKTAYVANLASGTVTPITVATSKAGKPIAVGHAPYQIVITSNGKTAYVAGDDGVTPVSTATNRAGKAIKTGYAAIAITPDGKTLYAYSDYYGTVTPISTATNKPGKAIKTGNAIKRDTPPPHIAITPDGKTVYVSGAGLGLTPVSTATGKAGKTIDVGGGGNIAITPAPRHAPVFQPAAASFWSAGSGVVLGAAGCAKLPCQARLVTTSDGGRHWRPVNIPSLQLVHFSGTGRVVNNVLFASRQVGWLYGGTGLWFTRDGGAHWRQLTLPGKVTALATAAGTAYAAVAPPRGSEELFRSPVGRAAWARVGTMTVSVAILAVSGRAAWFANASAFSVHAASLWATADGTHWHRYPFACPKGYGLADLAAATPSHVLFACLFGSGFAGGRDKEVLASTDGGKTTHLAGKPPAEGDLTGFAVPPGRPQVITAAAVSGASFLFTSANGGKAWTISTVGNSEPLNSLAYVNQTTGWVVLGMPGTGGTHALLRTINAGRTWHKISF
jgi:YVTN family beta-propeller protein